jgi:PKD repeat protein
VRYQDSYGNWSAYSDETFFATAVAAAKATISKPVASFSADKTDVVAGQDLVTFSDNSTPMAEIDLWAWDFGDGSATENWTSDMRPPNGKAFHNYTLAGSYTVKLTVYNGAAPAPQGQSTTVEIVVHAKPEAVFTLTPAAAQVGKEIAFTDASTPTADITTWVWQFDDGDTVTWTAADRQAAGGELKHAFKKSGTHTVSLTVKGPLGESYYNKQVNVTGAGGFKFGLWMIAAGVGLVVVIAGVVYLLRARRAK